MISNCLFPCNYNRLDSAVYIGYIINVYKNLISNLKSDGFSA